jgi:acetyl esterase/lipase
MNMKSLVLLAVMSNILAAGCEKSARINTPSETLSNISYGSDPKQAYDIFLPSGRDSVTTKVMFLFHGGSWSGGDKEDFNFYIDSLKGYLPGYAFVNVNYRLANYSTNKFPTQENDVKAAVESVMNKAGEYNISKKAVLLGASAGAHLALLQAYKYNNPVKIKAVVSFFGPTDMADMYNNPANAQIPFWLQVLLNGSPSTNERLYEQSSPVNFVNSESPPTFLLQGGIDPLVNPVQATQLKKKLDSAGVINQLVVYPNEGHGWIGASLTDSFRKLSAFLIEHVK